MLGNAGAIGGALGDLAGPGRLFRPFGLGGLVGPHLLSPEAHRHLVAGGFTCVLWHVIPRDWEATQTWPERAVELMRPLPWPLVVIHDLPTGAMRHLDRFIAMVRAEGGRFRQDFPPDCVSLRAGRETAAMAPYVSHRIETAGGAQRDT